ncbi:MAG: hypothetical protein AMXMBFR80_16480 [Dehalococcoidia bacterium]|nr:VOC family protein [Tepidiformaceae bacterium]
MRARGYRYLTVQVCDCDAEYAAALSRGAHHGRAPITPGVADRTAFVRDPDGNWLEIAQRAPSTRPAR